MGPAGGDLRGIGESGNVALPCVEESSSRRRDYARRRAIPSCVLPGTSSTGGSLLRRSRIPSRNDLLARHFQQSLARYRFRVAPTIRQICLSQRLPPLPLTNARSLPDLRHNHARRSSGPALQLHSYLFSAVSRRTATPRANLRSRTPCWSGLKSRT